MNGDLTSQEIAARIGFWLRSGDTVDLSLLGNGRQVSYIWQQVRRVLPVARRHNNRRLIYAPCFEVSAPAERPPPIAAGALAGWRAAAGPATVREMVVATGLSIAQCRHLLEALCRVLPLERRMEWRGTPRRLCAVYYRMDHEEAASLWAEGDDCDII